MAHKFSTKTVPHINKDGSPSKVKKDVQVWDQSRGKRTLVGVATSQKGAEELIQHTRDMLIADHLANHPNDHAFRAKHGIKEN